MQPELPNVRPDDRRLFAALNRYANKLMDRHDWHGPGILHELDFIRDLMRRLLGIRLREGARYAMACGETVGPMRRFNGRLGYEFAGRDTEGSLLTFTADGRFSKHESPFDLVAECPPESETK